MDTKTKNLEVLLVEDNPGDILLTKAALEATTIATQVAVVRDGEEALRYLKKESEFAQASTPDIILLDLNLPRLDGREVLGEIKKNSALRAIPVVVLTSSEAESDILQIYDLAANCYIVKPVEVEKFIDVVKTINGFWLDTVKLPSLKRDKR